MEDVLLGLPKIDYDRTAENVVEFLTNRSYYPRLYDICMQANPENLKSPSLNGMPGGALETVTRRRWLNIYMQRRL